MRYFFAGMQTFARNPKSTQFQFSRILNFQPHKIWPMRLCGVIRQSRLRINFNIYKLVRAAKGGQRNEVRSRSNLDLAPSSKLHYLGRSASRQSSLPINRDCQQTAINYLLYQGRAYTEDQIFSAFHKLLKRYMKAQQLVQCMVPRTLFEGVWNTPKSVYSSDS